MSSRIKKIQQQRVVASTSTKVCRQQIQRNTNKDNTTTSKSSELHVNVYAM